MADERAEAAVAEIVDDLRGRKFLKWLFDERPEDAGEIAPGIKPISADVQDEIFAAWAAIIEKHIK